ncbi:MAG: class I SAM-dependent methyltransferase [Burkholderiales bacterium]|nr:class I SAM-dependent methyltransferase [Burkholderiales bacterium]
MLSGQSSVAAPPKRFRGSRSYWKERYATGGSSGVGSYGKFAEFKAEVINAFVAQRCVRSVIEFGCGDGNQLTLGQYPEYFGLDVSEVAVELCRRRFASDPSKRFALMSDYGGKPADLALSLDVIYHLVEDDVFEAYMRMLFAAAARYVIVYSSDSEESAARVAAHVRHRNFSRWVARNLPAWRLLERIPNRYPYRGDYREGSFSDFFIYGKASGADRPAPAFGPR